MHNSAAVDFTILVVAFVLYSSFFCCNSALASEAAQTKETVEVLHQLPPVGADVDAALLKDLTNSAELGKREDRFLMRFGKRRQDMMMRFGRDGKVDSIMRFG